MSKFGLATVPTADVQSTFNFAEMANKSLIDASEVIQRQPVAVSCGYYDYKGTNYPIPLGSYGDFSCIVGESKSRKTFLKSAIEAGYLGGRSTVYFPAIIGHDTSDKYVASLDTEQSRFHTQRAQHRVLDMVGHPVDNYLTFSLRAYEPKERFEFIDWLVFESEYRNKIGLMSIDGIVDLVNDFNSLEQSTALTEKLLKWTAIGKMHITGILHKNFGTSKPVGHVGSSILKKSETVIFVTKEDEVTKVKCEYSRNIPFDDFYFEVNNESLPQEINQYKSKDWKQ